MKILVLSDSHASLRFMMEAVQAVRPDALIHLGDYYDDGETLHESYPRIPFYQVPGNCDCYRCPPHIPQILIEDIFGVRFYLTHGHRHNVKSTLTQLLKDARACGVQAALYGHTHLEDCHQEPDGLWVVNPGSCGYGSRSGAVIEVADRKILSCRIIHQEDLEEKV